jgi:uncharacterized DUF497 family protein
VKYFSWNAEKHAKLKAERGISFEDVVFHIERGDLLDTVEHPSLLRFGRQKIFVVLMTDYVYLVPFVEDEEFVFLKTIIPSRKATRKYLGKEADGECRVIPVSARDVMPRLKGRKRRPCCDPSSAASGSLWLIRPPRRSASRATPQPRCARTAG